MLSETVNALLDLNIDKTVSVYQIHYFILIDDILGKPSQRDFCVLKTQHWADIKDYFLKIQ